MTNPDKIFELAQQRAKDKNLPYTGALTPQEAFNAMQQNANVLLVDVRSRAELELVGKVPVDKVPQAKHIEWAFYPGMVANADFSKQLEENIDKASIVIFMCRAGGRSHNAAVVAQQLGYSQVYNMLEGFEGEANSLQQRTMINGWKHAGLPWAN